MVFISVLSLVFAFIIFILFYCFCRDYLSMNKNRCSLKEIINTAVQGCMAAGQPKSVKLNGGPV